MATRRYTRLYLLVFFSSLLAVAGFNGFMDPQGIFRLMAIEGINKEKPLLEKEGVRKTKSLDLEQGDFTTLLLGTSRTFGGLNPEHKVFPAGRTYNAALPRTNLYETQKVFDFALQHLPLKQVVMELDFTTFSDAQTVDADFKDSRFAGKNVKLSSLDSLLSAYQIQDSFTTLQFNLQGKQARYTAQGFRRKRLYGEVRDRASVGSDIVDHHKLFTWTNQQYLKTHSNLDFDSRDRIERLQQMLRAAREQNIEMHLFIPPLHVHLVESLKLTNLLPDYYQWKRDLVAAVDAHNQTYSTKPPIKLWDFSSVSSVTTERVPPENSEVQMKWYVESSHFRPVLGDVMLSLMLDSSASVADAPEDFGHVLTTQNVEAQVAQMNSDLLSYERLYPQDIIALKALQKELVAQKTAQR
ncbi:MAG: hypothetical protein AAF050_19105 [Cyanobacteria bacterium J06649_5]